MNSQPAVLLARGGPVATALADGLASRGLPVLLVERVDDVPTLTAAIDAEPVSVAPAVADLASLDATDWEVSAEEPLRRALHVLRGVRRRMAEDGGRIVVLLPSLVTSGAAGLVPWVAAAEGYRSLVKAAARAWGRDGITINCVLVPADLIAGTMLDRPGLQPPALGRAVDVESDVAGIVAALLTGDLGAVTGQTIAVDGGVWMTP